MFVDFPKLLVENGTEYWSKFDQIIFGVSQIVCFINNIVFARKLVPSWPMYFEVFFGMDFVFFSRLGMRFPIKRVDLISHVIFPRAIGGPGGQQAG